MQTRGPALGSTVAPEEVAALLGRPGPFATVYLCTEAAIDNAAQRSVSRWKPLRAGLIDQGTPEDVVAAVDPFVTDAHLHGDGLAVVVPAAGEPHVEHLPEAPRRDEVRWGVLPALGPLLASRQRCVPHVLAVLDRVGADLTAVRRVGPEATVEVEGDDQPIHKAKQGGWSQRRNQQRVNATWERNAGEVAVELARLAKRVDARLVLVAGDVRAVQLLRESLPDEVGELVREVEGSRADDGSAALSEHDVRRLLATEVAAETTGILQMMKDEGGRDERAVDGLAATAAAVSEARAAAVLVPEELEGTLWYGSDPVPVAMSRQALIDLGGGGDPREGPAADVLIRAAVGTAAGIRIVPLHSLPDGVGALLRW